MSVPLPWFVTVLSSLFWKGLANSPSLVEVGTPCGWSSQPLLSREGAGWQVPASVASASPCQRGVAVSVWGTTGSRLSGTLRGSGHPVILMP